MVVILFACLCLQAEECSNTGKSRFLNASHDVMMMVNILSEDVKSGRCSNVMACSRVFVVIDALMEQTSAASF